MSDTATSATSADTTSWADITADEATASEPEPETVVKKPAQTCKFGKRCTNKRCTRIHDDNMPVRRRLCRDGDDCRNPDCTFGHTHGRVTKALHELEALKAKMALLEQTLEFARAAMLSRATHVPAVTADSRPSQPSRKVAKAGKGAKTGKAAKAAKAGKKGPKKSPAIDPENKTILSYGMRYFPSTTNEMGNPVQPKWTCGDHQFNSDKMAMDYIAANPKGPKSPEEAASD